MLAPHGNDLVDRVQTPAQTDAMLESFDDVLSVTLSPDIFSDLVNIATGRYSPLKGFLTRNDYHKVVNDLTLETGVPWPLPIVLDIDGELASELSPGDRLGLRAPTGNPAAMLDVADIYRFSVNETCEAVFGTTDVDHPGVQTFEAKSPFLVGGSVRAVADVGETMDERALTPQETRVLFKHLDWSSVVGFQTRNAPHRAHEYIQKSALEHVDGLFIHPKSGFKKPGDYRDNVILDAYDALVSSYYPEESVVLAPFPSKMWYAGPREAVFDAIVRQNYGCTHFIIGRDHAGVGDYYADFAAQELFESLPGLKIEPLFFHYAFYCERCDGMASEKVCPHDPADHLEPSGTGIRSRLQSGDRPPTELMRPEVAAVIANNDEPFVGGA